MCDKDEKQPACQPEADGKRIHGEVVKLIRNGIGLVTFLRTPSDLIHPVLILETVLALEAAGYTVDVSLVEMILQHVRDTQSLKGL
jgi:hypothetical protein